MQLLVGRCPASTTLEVVVRAEACADLIPELSMAREFGRALHGAAPVDVIGSVPGRWIVQDGQHWLNRWLELTGDTENAAFMMLTACRMWRFAATGEHSFKTAAALWVLARDPSLMAVRQARSAGPAR
ncbi:DUF4111 domain-containing protein [Actinocrinis puniceicyclus]|uniref:DUF4111 domain-containing protein n=1 Tax=Actinocrinis puniceicyclus TaxID=977794 RepID=A0A8J7WQM5_9ACTN|nr:aminoglycoside adenylyltransferase domain-containing protein [Actinocrinis puniceicyclus]MBS2966841.1 DUF4111 domain-containing protein [Actinocrinis puniceicyclus]